MIFLGIIISIIIFSIIVFVHEMGHFLCARFFGVKVEEFGIGIPPRAKKLFTDKKGTLFSLNWIPIGGFVRLKGEQFNPGEENEKSSFINKKTHAQLIIILGGVCMNFIFAIVIFSILFMVGVKPLGINTKIATTRDVKLIPNYSQALESGFLVKNPGIILYPIAGSQAEKSGIKSGDVLQGFIDIPTSSLNPQDVIKTIQIHAGKQLIFIINNKNIALSIPNNGKIGAYIGENITINKEFRYKYNFTDALKYGSLETYHQSIITLQGMGMILKNIVAPDTPQERSEAIQEVSGPIGIVNFITQSFQQGIVFLCIISAIISINLGVFNLLPIPALDGGRFIFIIIDKLTKKIFPSANMNTNIQAYIHAGFFIVLIALSLIIAYNDVYKIITH